MPKISNQNDVAFGSRIVFLSPKGFKNVLKKNRYKIYENIHNYEIHNDEKYLYNGYRTKVKRGYTSGVKSCTAGLCVNKGKKAPVFWHIENTFANIQKFPILSKLFKGTNSIIIGSKGAYNYSSELFDAFNEQMHKKHIPTTIIKGLDKSEASLFYESKKDTLFVCIQDIYIRSKYARSMNDLNKMCDVVKISSADSVEFLDELPKESIKQKILKIFNIEIK